MKYLVTGAAGFIGSHLCEALLGAGHELAAVDAFTDYYDPTLKEENARGLSIARDDLVQKGLELDGVDGIFHLAGQPGVRASWGADFDLYVSRNVVATQRVFEVAAQAGVRVVWSSSSSIYGDAETYPTSESALPRPISPYGVTKLTCEHLQHAYGRQGLDAVALRYFTVYGPRQRPDMAFTRMLSALAERRPFELYGDGSQSRGFTYVSDAVTAAIAAMEHAPAGAVYNVGGGSEATIAETIELAQRIAELELNVVRTPAAAGDARRTAADTAAIRRDLEWVPAVPLERGLRAQWEWVLSRVSAR